MSKVFHGIGIMGRVLFAGILLVGNLIANIIGLMLCAITSEG